MGAGLYPAATVGELLTDLLAIAAYQNASLFNVLSSLGGSITDILQALFNDGEYLGVTLGAFLQELFDGDVGLDITLGDILAGLLSGNDFEWELINLNAVDLSDFASEGGVVTYQAAFTVTGATSAEISVTLPARFNYVPGSSTAFGEPAYDPTADPQVLTWSLTGLTSGAANFLTFGARPGLTLETVQATGSLTVASLSDSGDAITTVVEAFEDNGPGSPTAMAENTIYVSHISSAADADYFLVSGVRQVLASPWSSATPTWTLTSCFTNPAGRAASAGSRNDGS